MVGKCRPAPGIPIRRSGRAFPRRPKGGRVAHPHSAWRSGASSDHHRGACSYRHSQEPSSELSQLASYYPEPYWLTQESSWVKSLLLFFDGVAILLPDYLDGQELVADPTLAEPLADQGLLKVLQPEWFVDQQLADRLAEGMVELIVGGAFDGPYTPSARSQRSP
jgi:hypothetical protein